MGDASVVHIIDDDETLGRALGRLFRSVGHEVAIHGSVDEFLSAARVDAPSCLVLDVRLPGLGGLEFQSQLGEWGVRLPVVLMTGHGDIPMTVQAMKAGAVDFLAKPFRDQDMLAAVSVAIERDRARLARDHDADALAARYATLTPREQEVMAGVTAGRMNKQVAGDLGLSEVTVKIHRGSVMRKMEARTLAELVRMADALRTASPSNT